MKKFLQFGKKSAFVLMLLISATVANAQTRTASQDGPWNVTTTWGGQSVPTSSDDVVINPGIDLTLASGANAECKSITFATSGTSTTASTLAISSGYKVTVTNAITLNNAAGNNRSATISGAGSIFAGSLVVGGTNTSPSADATTTLNSTITNFTISGIVSVNSEDNGSNDNDAAFSIQSGVVSVGGVITLDSDNSSGAVATISLQSGAQSGKLILTNAAPFTLTGSGTETTSFNGTTSAVSYAGSDQAILSTTYRNLQLSGTGTKTMAGTINGTFTNGGDNTLAGTITYGASAILTYAGTVAQTSTAIEFPTNMTADVVINNPNGVTLNAAKNLSGSLTLTSGVLYTTATNLLNFPDNFSTVNGGSTVSYIDGPVRKTGNNAFTFPLGKNGVYAPLTITNPNENGDVFTAEYVRESARALGSISASGLAQVSSCEYWNLTETADPGNDNTISVTLTWSSGSGCSANYVTDITKLTIAHFNGTNWSDFAGVASGSSTNGTIIRTAVSSFSPFTLGSTDASVNPLPVSFTGIKAFEKGSGVQIEWSNDTESDMSTYVIERSSNGIDFTAIGQIAPRSNQFDRVSYSYTDATPLSGTNFYRIKAIELSGKNVYTKSLRVDIGRNPKGISLYPNPVRGTEVNIGFTALKGQYSLNVLNSAGQVVYRQQLNHAGGTVAQSVSLPASLKAGVYNVLITGDNYKETKMFVVQ